MVCRSVCLSVALVNPAKTAEPNEMLFKLRTGNHVLDGGAESPWEVAIFWGKGHPIVKYKDTLRSSVQQQLNQSRCHLGLGLGLAQGIMN